MDEKTECIKCWQEIQLSKELGTYQGEQPNLVSYWCPKCKEGLCAEHVTLYNGIATCHQCWTKLRDVRSLIWKKDPHADRV